MPVTVRRKPSDVVWSDIDHRWITDSKGNVKLVNNVDSVITSMDNIMSTYLGERVMLPEFASRMRSLMFEPINEDTMGFLANEVKRVVEAWDDRVKIMAISTTADPDRSIVSLDIEFAVKRFQGVFTYTKKFT